MNEMLILAQAAAPAGGTGGQSPMFTMGLMVILVGGMFFMQWRASTRKEKERKEMLANVKTGDRVLFSGGIIGVITNVKEKTYVVRVGDKTKFDVLRGAVTSVLKSDDLPSDTEADLAKN